MTGQGRIRVLLVDDHTLFRQGIARLLRAEPDFEVVGEAGDGLEAIERAQALQPDVILMDVNMPRATGLEAARRIRQTCPQSKIVMLTISEVDATLFEAVKSGAQGYLLKDMEPQVLFETLRGVARAEASISPRMTAKLLGEFARQARGASEGHPSSPTLSEREKSLLALIAEGKSNKEVAAALGLAENTVKSHLKNLLAKLHLENRVQAAAFALQEGLAPSPKGGVPTSTSNRSYSCRAHV